MDNNVKCLQNREISWLKFNERVLEEADDITVPIFERLKFISIFTSNLDEFFMVRVGSLYDISLLEPEYRDKKTNMTANEQLEKIYETVNELYKKRTRILNNVTKELKNHRIVSLDYDELTENEKTYIENYFLFNINPLLCPCIVDSHHPFPFIENKTAFIIMTLKHKEQESIGIIPVPESLPEILFLPGSNIRFIKTEKIVFSFADKVFKKYHVAEKNYVCLTRNADIRFDEQTEKTKDNREIMRELLSKRSKKCVVRMEAYSCLSSYIVKKFCEKLNISQKQIFITTSEFKMGYLDEVRNKLTPFQKTQLTYNPFVTENNFESKKIMPYIFKNDLLLFYPFDSMSTFLQLIKEAAYNSKVTSIKITIYRLSKNSKLVDYLCAAAENGKNVFVLIELRARFDENNNIDWSEKLENSGCRVIYGLKDYKVHCKVCLITYMRGNRIKYITQVGTGNYNEKTAEAYTDFSFITGESSIGNDAEKLFVNLLRENIYGNYTRLLVAPSELKSKLIDLIDNEIKKGNDGQINIKINSLSDIDFINKFIEASQAGVTINLIVRGICCIVPQIRGMTDKINVISVVGRFLEHSRIYSFGKGDNQMLYISSADLMTRNTERRVEVACPITDEGIKKQINTIFNSILKDNIKARVLQSDGLFEKKFSDSEPFDSQAYFIEKRNQNSISNEQKKSFFSKLKRMRNKNA